MGVRGLQQFAEESCPGCIRKVNLATEAQAYMQRENRVPVLVVDGYSGIAKWYGGLDWVCGGQWQEYLDVMRSWVQAFQRACIKLVFIFDGAVIEKKRPVWLTRAKQKRRQAERVFEHIKLTKTKPKHSLFIIPKGLGLMTLFMLKYELGQTVISSVGEGDREIFEFVDTNNCWGVLTQDSDFLIYNAGCYFSIQKLDVWKMKTVSYNRNALCEHLRLTLAELPILSTLVGNDIINYTTVAGFHNRVTGKKSDDKPSSQEIIYAVAYYISQNFDVGHYYESLSALLQDVSNYSPKIERMTASVNSFLSGKNIETLQQGSVSYINDLSVCLGQKLSISRKQGLAKPHGADIQMKGKKRSSGRGIPQSASSPRQPHTAGSYSTSASASLMPEMPASVSETKHGATLTASERYYSSRPSAEEMQHTQSQITSCSESQQAEAMPLLSASPSVSSSRALPNVSQEVMYVAQQRHLNSNNLPLIFNVLSGVTLDSGVALEDGEDSSIPPTSILLNGMRQRLFGLLLGVQVQHQRTSEISRDRDIQLPEGATMMPCSELSGARLVVNVNAVLEWLPFPGAPLTGPYITEALALDSLPGGTPTLERLWLVHDSDTVALRWRTLVACCLCTIPIEELQKLPPKLIGLVCVLHYLLKQQPDTVLSSHDIDAFIAVAVSPALQRVDRLKALRVNVVESRAVHLAAVFQQALLFFVNVVSACGYPVPVQSVVTWHIFNGKLFHTKYQQAHSGGNTKLLCEHQPDVIAQFNHLKSLIVMDTRLDVPPVTEGNTSRQKVK